MSCIHSLERLAAHVNGMFVVAYTSLGQCESTVAKAYYGREQIGRYPARAMLDEDAVLLVTRPLDLALDFSSKR